MENPRRTIIMIGVNRTNIVDREVLPSVSSLQAFEYITDMIIGSNVDEFEIIFVNVRAPLELPAGQNMDGGPSSAVIIAKDITESIRLVQYFKDMCSMRNIRSHGLNIESCNVGATLVAQCAVRRADLLVVGRRGIPDQFSSVSMVCMMGGCDCPVLPVPRRLDSVMRLQIYVLGLCHERSWPEESVDVELNNILQELREGVDPECD